MRQAGFDDVRVEGHIFASDQYDAETYGVAIIPLISDFAAGRAAISPNEAADWAGEQRALGDRDEYFFTCTQFCFQGTKSR